MRRIISTNYAVLYYYKRLTEPAGMVTVADRGKDQKQICYFHSARVSVVGQVLVVLNQNNFVLLIAR